MSVDTEFATVDLILKSEAETRGVDAFTLSLIKTEKQLRRLITHLVYQSPAFNLGHVTQLRAALHRNTRVYANKFIPSFNALYSTDLKTIVGPDYEHLFTRFTEATTHRNKIFHGQLTADWLSRDALVTYAQDMRTWCSRVAEGSQRAFGYDGLSDSFKKSAIDDLHTRLRIKINDVPDYEAFIATHMQR
jgi:hypothetical protein